MKIVVIGSTRYIRSETAERLRRQGHEVVAAPLRSRISTITAAPRDPGHAGRPLRELLENLWFGASNLASAAAQGKAVKTAFDGIIFKVKTGE